MGLLRYLLALTVLIGHVGDIAYLNVLDGSFSVEVFFVISGFYMALILEKKYERKKHFYLSRFFRLYPVYFFLALISLICILASGSVDYSNLSPMSLFYLIFTNLTMLGQDLSLFMEFVISSAGERGLSFIKDYTQSSTGVYQYLLIAPSWSLSLEIYFYFFIPFIIKLKPKHIFGLMSLSLASKFIGYFAGLNVGGFLFRFFPFELCFFLYGVLLYRYKTSVISFCERMLPRRKTWGSLLMYCLIISIVLFSGYLDAVFYRRTSYIFVFLLPLLIPVLFDTFKGNRVDNFIGELSYPVYLLHIIIRDNFPMNVYGNVLVTTIAAILLVLFVDRRVDNWRHYKFANRSKEDKT